MAGREDLAVVAFGDAESLIGGMSSLELGNNSLARQLFARTDVSYFFEITYITQ